MVVNAQDKIERRAVRVAGTVSSGILIASGLSGSDRVVTTAGAFLQEGEPVKVQATKNGA